MSKNYTEVTISEQPDSALFQRLANRLIAELGAEIVAKTNDIDSAFWDFQIESEIITLHQDTFMGVSIFPKDLQNASKAANELVQKVAIELTESEL